MRPMRSLVLPSLAILLLAAPAQALRLQIVHANDTHGHALPYGDDDDLAGMARLATVVNQAKTAEPNTLFLSAGDTFEGTLFFNAGLGEFDFALLQMMGCDGVAVGNHDFAVGTGNLLSSFQASGATYPYFAGNIDLTGVSQALDPILVGNYTGGVQDPTPYVVKVMPNGLRVGMFGFVTSETRTIQPEAAADGVIFYDTASAPTAYAIAQAIVNQLRGPENVDIVIMLNHEGLDTGSAAAAQENDRKIAQNVTDIDVIVGGHDHLAPATTTVVNGTVCVYAGAYSRYAGVLDLDVNPTTNTTTVTSFQLRELNRTVAEDPTLQAAIAGYKAQVEALYPGAYTDVVGHNHVFGDGARNGESGLGNLVVDAYRIAAASDAAVEATGSIRFDTFRGTIYPAELFNVLSLDFTPALGGTVPLRKVSIFGTVPAGAIFPPLRGQPLFKAILELLVSDFIANNFPSAGAWQFAGTTFEHDRAVADFVRIQNLMVNGAPFNAGNTYTLSTSENIGQQFALIDTLLGLTGQPNSLATNSSLVTAEPWEALRDLMDGMGRTTCYQGSATGRARTVQADIGFGSECGVDVEPRAWTPSASVDVSLDVRNFGMTASTTSTATIYYEATPADPTPNWTLFGTLPVGAVPAWSAGAPGRLVVSGTFTVPAALAAGIYPVRVQLANLPSEYVTANNTIDAVAPKRGNFIAGHGAGQSQGSEVRIFNADGVQVCSFAAYGTGQFGVDVGSGDLDGIAPGRDEGLTAPGPGPIFGPHVRGWNVSVCPATALAKVNFYAYGTLRYGARIYAGDIDGDGFDEILTGAGNGGVFGPHVRGWNVDGGALASITKVNFFAYSTLRYGVDPATADVDRDGYHEILTTPGAGIIFGHQIRGFNYDGTSVTSIAKINFFASSYMYGGTIAGGDIDGDGYGEILTAPGPGPTNPAELCYFDTGGGGASACFQPFPGGLFGANVGHGNYDGQPWEELLGSQGPDPMAATAELIAGRGTLGDTSAASFSVTARYPVFPSPYGATIQGGHFGW